MSMQLQQPDSAAKSAGRMADLDVRVVALNAMSALLLGLALLIIPTTSGVTLIG